MSTLREQIAQFYEQFQPPERLDFQEALIREEVAEAREALLHLAKELADMQYTIAGWAYVWSRIPEDERPAELPAIMDEADEVFNATRYLMNHVEGEENLLFTAVHESNMSKLDQNGDVVYNPDTGKVLKGPFYKEPKLEPIIFNTPCSQSEL